MPITSSAKKALRNSKKKRVYNIRRKEGIQGVVKDIKNLIKEKKAKEAMKLLPAAYKALDKAAKANTIKKNAASRKKSRLAQAIKKLG